MTKKSLLVISAVLFVLWGTISPAAAHAKTDKGKALSDPVKKPFFIQVGSYKKLPNAENQVSFLHSKNIKAFMIQEEAGRKGKYFRVYLGPYPARERARNSARDLVSKGLISSFWIKSKSLPVPGLSTSRPVDHHLRSKAPPSSGKNLFELSGLKNPENLLLSIRSKPIESSGPGEPEKKISTDDTAEYPRLAGTKEKETEQIINQSRGNKKSASGPLSIGIRAGINNTPHVKDLYILSKGSIYRFEFGQSRPLATLLSSLNITKRLSLEAGYGRTLATDLDYWFVTFGPRFYPVRWSAFSSYVRAGLLWGDLGWDKIPGDFKGSFGFEGGIGLDYSLKRYRLGAEISYRNLEFEYEPPSGVFSNRDGIDFSGFSFMGSLTYFF